MNLMGMNAGICRMPLIEMSENNADILKASMKKSV